jgi:hypothetical protein
MSDSLHVVPPVDCVTVEIHSISEWDTSQFIKQIKAWVVFRRYAGEDFSLKMEAEETFETLVSY